MWASIFCYIVHIPVCFFVLDGVNENTKSSYHSQYLVFWENNVHWCNKVAITLSAAACLAQWFTWKKDNIGVNAFF